MVDFPRSVRPATDGQRAIIRAILAEEGAQDIDFEPCLPLLSSWAAHVVISGLLVLSEVRRSTGRREFKPGDLRRAVREFIQRNAPTKSGLPFDAKMASSGVFSEREGR